MQTAPQTPVDPTATFEADDSLRAVKLSGRINYLHCDGGGDRDSHGVMTFVSKNGAPLFVKEVNSREDFHLNYNVFRMMEDLL
jgi:hypothetical protein